MSDRTELVAAIWSVETRDFGGYSQRDAESVADALLAAGYRKPRVIKTADELDTLPEGTTIVDQAERLTLEETSIQYLEWVDRHGNACHVELPATVLWAPEA